MSSTLVDEETKSKILYSLKRFHESKTRVYNTALNIIVAVFILLFGAFTAYACRANRKSPVELFNKQLQDQQYVIDKIRAYKGMMDSEQMMTRLPVTSNTNNRV